MKGYPVNQFCLSPFHPITYENKCEVRRPNFKFIFLYVLCFLHFFYFSVLLYFCTFVLLYFLYFCTFSFGWTVHMNFHAKSIWDQPEKTGNTSQHTPSNLNVNQTNTKRLPVHPNGSSKEKGNPISPKREHSSFKTKFIKTKTKYRKSMYIWIYGNCSGLSITDY